MRGKSGVCVIVGLLVLSLILVNFIPFLYLDGESRNSIGINSEPEMPNLLLAYTPHDPISINGDSNFSATALAEGWVGDGSAETPFVIEGLEIDRGGGVGHCINISNTRVNFTIRHCNLTGATVTPGSGIYLHNVSHGVLQNNTCNYNRYGISLVDSNFNTLYNNTCTGNVYGLYLNDADSNRVSENHYSGNIYGVVHYDCDLNEFLSNICSNNGYDGIYGEDAVSNTLINNTCNGNGRDGISVVYYSSGNIFSNNTCNANNQRGIQLFSDDSLYLTTTVANNTCNWNTVGNYVAGSYLNVINNDAMDNEDYGFWIGCSESTITNNAVERSLIGFYIEHMAYSALSHNRITETYDGIILNMARENTISHNTITEVDDTGIHLEMESDLNHIFLNDIIIPSTFWGMEWYGIILESHCYDNNVTLNSIRGEWYPEAYLISDGETGLTNIIDRNYYDDYEGSDDDDDGIGEEPYAIHGSAGNSDLSPLVFPPFGAEWVEQPTNQVLDFWDQPFYYDLNATAPSSITWQVNDTSQFTIDSSGIIQPINNLAVGLFGLRVIVTNIYGVAISCDFKLIVQEITGPEWIVGPSDVTLDFGEGFELAVIATDQSGLISWTLNDTSNFNVSVTHLNVTGYENGWYLIQIVNTTSLVLGVYTLNVSVSDPYGNILNGLFSITILPQEDVSPPVWVVLPVNETLEHKTPFTQRLGAWDESGIHYWWLNDSTYFTIDEEGVIQNCTLLEAGTYRLEVRAYDPFDNYCSAVFVVTILESIASTTTTTTTIGTITTPTTNTNGTTQNGFDPLAVIVLIAGVTSAVIVLVVLVLYRKRSMAI